MEAAIREVFGDLGQGGRAARRSAPPPPRDRGFALIDRPGAPQSTIMLGMRVPDPSNPAWIPLDGHGLAARRLVRLAHHVEHPRAEGLHLLAAQLVSTNIKTAHWVETADVTTA